VVTKIHASIANFSYREPPFSDVSFPLQPFKAGPVDIKFACAISYFVRPYFNYMAHALAVPHTTDVSIDLIASISDPEHPLTLGQLAVVNLPDIHINPSPLSRMSTTNADPLVRVLVDITPTINHCSLATVIGLAVRARLEQALPPNYRVQVRVKPGTHTSDDQATKQLADKERVVAALENSGAKRTVEAMLATC
jgi:metal-sulfur cluster biosynthetic enzyme